MFNGQVSDKIAIAEKIRTLGNDKFKSADFSSAIVKYNKVLLLFYIYEFIVPYLSLFQHTLCQQCLNWCTEEFPSPLEQSSLTTVFSYV